MGSSQNVSARASLAWPVLVIAEVGWVPPKILGLGCRGGGVCMPGMPHKKGCVVRSVSLLGKGCCNRVKVGKLKVFRYGQGTAVLCNLWWKGMGRPRLYF